MLFLILICLLSLTASVRYACGPGKPCIFINKEIGVVDYEERASLNLTYPIISDSWRHSNTTLFYSIASYRDKLCPNTLFQAFIKAAYPSRIRIGLVQQNYLGDVDCLVEYCRLMYHHLHPHVDNQTLAELDNDFILLDCPFKDNIRVTRIDAIDAKGPTWARAIGSMMVEDEEFCMQSDAHMDFLENWDTGIMSMWALTNNEYAVLSTYVYDSAILSHMKQQHGKGINGHHEAAILCQLRFDGMHDMPRIFGATFMVNIPKPKLTNMMFGAGFGFSKCHAERKVPYDPHLAFIFDGEEFSRAIRLWTWGYDIYSPHRVYIFHNYKVAQADPKRGTWHWENRESKLIKNQEIKNSVQRLQMLFSMPRNGTLHPDEDIIMQQSKYGLGDRRTLDQAIFFSGVDTKRLTTSFTGKCGNLDYIPFVQHPWGPEYVPKYHNVTEEFIDVRDPGSIYYDSYNISAQHAWEEANQLHKMTFFKKHDGIYNIDISFNNQRNIMLQYLYTMILLLLILVIFILLIPRLCDGVIFLCFGWTVPYEMKNLRYEIATERSIKIV